MSPPTSDACAASVLFNLPDYRVLEVLRNENDGERTVVVTSTATEAACPGCGGTHQPRSSADSAAAA